MRVSPTPLKGCTLSTGYIVRSLPGSRQLKPTPSQRIYSSRLASDAEWILLSGRFGARHPSKSGHSMTTQLISQFVILIPNSVAVKV